jgi:hypothetical protein
MRRFNRVITLLFLLFSVPILPQDDSIYMVDSTFNYYYIDESTPLPFSPVLSFTFGIPDSAHIIVEVHKILVGSDSSGIMKTYPIIKLIDKDLAKGKYQVWWDGKNENGKNMKKEEKYIYYLFSFRKIHTINGLGYIKVEAKSKIVFPMK